MRRGGSRLRRPSCRSSSLPTRSQQGTTINIVSAFIVALKSPPTRNGGMWMRHRVGRLTLALLGWCATLGATAPALSIDIGRTVTTQAVPSPRQGLSDAYIVSFGLFGPESVFESEARGAARVLQAWFGATVEPVVRFNSKRRAFATTRTVAATLRAAGAAMDRDKEVLVVVLSSHGSPDGLAIVAGRREDALTPVQLRQMLDASGAKYRVVIISACYSGVFVPALADRRTLVITAAAADRPSFGCEDGATWTYFGDAFFNRALRTAPSLALAFDQARRLVTAREKREGFEPSNPQLAGGSELLALLARPKAAKADTGPASAYARSVTQKEPTASCPRSPEHLGWSSGKCRKRAQNAL